MIGSALDKYEILEEIGQGGMATVYRARDSRLQREVAIKVLHPHLARQPDARRRFHREAHAVARLKHTSILEIYDYSGDDAAVSYIVTEYVHGESLRDHLNRRTLAFPEIGEMIALQVLAALQHAHDHGVIHRDVKPENVLIRKDGVIKLADFGIAHLVDGQGMTMTGTVLGSPAHMSPEQIQGGELGPSSDIFSLGTVLYRMVTGELPFQAPNPQALFRKILAAEHPQAQPLAPLTSDRLNRCIERALASRPEDRFPSAQAMAAELLEDLEEVGLADPAAQLRSYLEDPDAYEDWLRPRLLEALVARAGELLQDGEKGRALSLYNRALCLDPQEPRVLAAVQAIGKDRRWRNLLSWVALLGLALAVSGVLAFADRLGAFSFLRGHPAPVPAVAPDAALHAGEPFRAGIPVAPAAPGAVPEAHEMPDEGAAAAGSGEPATDATADLRAAAGSGKMASLGPEPGSSAAAGTRAKPPGGPATRTSTSGTRIAAAATPPVTGRGDERRDARAVVPQQPVEVKIASSPWSRLRVDGVHVGKPLLHHAIALSPGKHRLTLEHPQCAARVVEVDVPAGSRPMDLGAFYLDWLPARLQVDGPEGSEVLVIRGRERIMLGESGRVYELPMAGPKEKVTVQVLQKGRVSPLYSTTRELQPAMLAEIKVPQQ